MKMNRIDSEVPMNDKFLDGLLEFLSDSPTPFHAVKNLKDLLSQAGFEPLEETNAWDIKSDSKYFVTRNDSSIIAFAGGNNPPSESGIRLIGAHLDSPCLKLNPNPIFSHHGYQNLNVEVYGSVLLRTWFDRDLSVAGRIYFKDTDGRIASQLVDLCHPIGVIPSLAIHLDRNANTKQRINSQLHLNPVVTAFGADAGFEFYEYILDSIEFKDKEKPKPESVLGANLSLYDTCRPARVGVNQEFIASARIDNLVSCYAGAIALIESEPVAFRGFVFSDHEEVGSVSDSGAQGNFLANVIDRAIGLNPEITRKSVLLSADGAHAIHPNYPDKHDTHHAPVINQGLVIKVNTNQRYATTGETLSLVRNIANELGLATQIFISRNDIPCGTTIGPISASEIGIKTVDVGVAQFAMHSIRELCGSVDAYNFYRLLTAFLSDETVTVFNS